MTNRVNSSEVQEILGDENLDSPTLEAFITAANLTVTTHLGESDDLSDAQRKEIERWLSAHLAACARSRKVESQSVDKASISYQGKTALGLDATLYGQQVKLLDTTGTLAKLDKTIGLRDVSVYAIPSFD